MHAKKPTNKMSSAAKAQLPVMIIRMKEAALITGLSRATLYRLVKAGELPNSGQRLRALIKTEQATQERLM